MQPQGNHFGFDPDSNEQMLKNAKGILCLEREYSYEQIVDAMLMNDNSELDKMRARNLVLKSAYEQFKEDIESGNPQRRKNAIDHLKRPPK